MHNVLEIQNALKNNALISCVDTVPKGHIRIETGFLYPDGAFIDVFLEQQNGIPNLHKPKLTDFGGTWSWLQNLDLKPTKTKSTQKHYERVLEIYGCTQAGAAIERELNSLDEIQYGIIDLAQACLRTADLIYTKRQVSQNQFEEEVEDIIADMTLEYEPKYGITGKNGNIIQVDFRVRGHHRESAILTLGSSRQVSAAHQRATEINMRWDDIKLHSDWLEKGNQCVTIYDDRIQDREIYNSKDIDILRYKSTLIAVSDTDNLKATLVGLAA